MRPATVFTPLAFLLALLIAAPGFATTNDCIQAAQGSTRDFSCWDLSQEIVLDGTWRVLPGKHPEEMTPEFLTGPDWVEAPRKRTLRYLGLPLLNSEITYQLALTLPDADLPLYLRLGESYTNLRAWVTDVNGELVEIHNSREVATDRVLRLPPLGTSTTLVFHIENTLHPGIAGIAQPPRLGTQASLESGIRGKLIFGAFSVGALTLLALINFGLWAARPRDMAPFYLAVGALTMCFRLMDTGRLLPLLVPDLPYFFQWQFGWYTMEFFILCWVLYVQALNPQDIPSWLVKLTAVISATVIVATYIKGEALAMVEWGRVVRLYGLVVFLFTAWSLVRLMMRGSAVSRSLFLSLIVAVGAMLIDTVLLALQLATVPQLSNYAFLVFVALQTMDMNSRYLLALKESEALTNRLEERVGERTQALTQANEKLEQLAATDGLTGLRNRRAFNDNFREELARVSRSGEALCLAILDIDFFKAINDRYGHDMGDHVLIELARLLEKELRVTDTVARIGGEEFAVLLPTQQARGAADRIETLRQKVAATPLEHDGHSVSVTFSIGLTQVLADDSMDSATKRADTALYEAKAAGRNQLKVSLIDAA